ncbi:MAG: hypothetical protein LBQ60_09845 [Bacteroidales bacterium]|jgi:hypothetical protein|nr:hypothetical protein [Bacteroidales bacterium]
MKITNFIIFSLIITVLSCSKDNTVEIAEPSENPSKQSQIIRFMSETDNVSILVFNENNNDFYYQKTISPVWAADGSAYSTLALGNYKFLFLKSEGLNTIVQPDPLNSNSNFTDFHIAAKEDPDHPGYYLPVDEIWFPETTRMADSTYTIAGKDTIRNKLKRAVSQVVVNINRATSINLFVPAPFKNGKNITEYIREIQIEAIGVGDSIDIYGGKGNVSSLFSTDQADITADGFAVVNGPMLFPPTSGTQTQVRVTLVPTADSPFPEMKKTITGTLERNKQLEITLWLTITFKFAEVTIKNISFSDGDEGIWN